MMTSIWFLSLLALSGLRETAFAWTLPRRFLAPALAGAALCWSQPAMESRAAGTLSDQLAAMQAAQAVLDSQDVEWKPVSSNPTVTYRDYRFGRGVGPRVAPGASVAVEMTVRIKGLSTQKDPGGVRYYSTKLDTPNNELAWSIGDGRILPALEAAMEGMERGSLRRVETPSLVVFAARKAQQLPLPLPTDDEGTRRFSRLFKSDATLIFEILVKDVKEAPSPE